MDSKRFLPDLDDEESMERWMVHKTAWRNAMASGRTSPKKRRWRWSELREYEKVRITTVFLATLLILLVLAILVVDLVVN